MKNRKKTWITVVVSVFVLMTIAVPFWSFGNIEDKLNDEASMLDSYKALESTRMEWNGRNCYLIVPGNINEDNAQDAVDGIEGIQGVRNVKIIYDESIQLADEKIEEPDDVTPQKTLGGFVLQWNPDDKVITGELDEDSAENFEDNFAVKGIIINDEFFISDDMMDKLESFGVNIYEVLSEGKLEVDGDKVKITGTVADADNYENLVSSWSKFDWLNVDLKMPEPDDGDIDEVQMAIDTLLELDNIQFDFNETSVAESSVVILDAIADILLKNEEIYIDIIGHTDSVGSLYTNQYFSEKRAEEVMEELENRGVDTSRMNSYGMGETMLLDTGNTDEAHALNRRVEIIVGGND